MSNYCAKIKWVNLRFCISEFYRKNRWLIWLLGILLVVSLLTGIFTAIKLYNIDNSIELDDYSMNALIDGSVYSFGYFMLRLLSCAILVGLLYIFSLNSFVSTFGVLLLMYRAFLITLNCVLVVIKLGVGGTITALLIILPCQLICSILLTLIFITLINIARERKKCGISNSEYMKLFTILSILLFVIDIVEIVLLLIFKPTTILII